MVASAAQRAGAAHFEVPLRNVWSTRFGVVAEQRAAVIDELVRSGPARRRLRARPRRPALASLPTKLRLHGRPRRPAGGRCARGLALLRRPREWPAPRRALPLPARVLDDRRGSAGPRRSRNRVGDPVAGHRRDGPGAAPRDGGPDAGPAGPAVPRRRSPSRSTSSTPGSTAADRRWLARKAAALDGGAHHPESDHEARFRDRDELRYSLRSLVPLRCPGSATSTSSRTGSGPSWLVEDERPGHRRRPLARSSTPSRPADLQLARDRDGPAPHRGSGRALPLLQRRRPGRRARCAPRPSSPATAAPAVLPVADGRSRSARPPPTTPPQLSARRHTQRLLTCPGRPRRQPGSSSTRRTRSVAASSQELESLAAPELSSTASHRVRDADDVVLVWLYHYYAYFAGKAIPSEIALRLLRHEARS